MDEKSSRVAHVTAAFREMLARIPTSPELKTFLSARGDAEALVASTSEYRARVKAVIDRVLRPVVGTSAGDAECDAFLAFCRDAGARAHACDAAVVRDFVGGTPAFQDKFGPLVDQIYRIELGRVPDRATRAAMAARFRDEAFTPEALAELIRAAPGPGGAGVAHVAGAGEGAAGAAGEAGAGAEVVHSAVARIADELEFVERWRRATGRRVDVYEFLRYYGELGSAPAPEAIRAVQRAQDESFARASAIYADYMGAPLDFERFTALHLHEYDARGFAEALVAKIVASCEYRARMCEAVAAAYTAAFDSAIHPEDLEHAFAALRARSVSLRSEEIHRHVVALGEELAAVCDSVSAVYDAVLRRAPDALEVRAAVPAYRAIGAGAPGAPFGALGEIEAAESALRDSLYDEPEYREVLKALIQEATGLASNADVFRVMRRVLAECGGDMRRAADHVPAPADRG